MLEFLTHVQALIQKLQATQTQPKPPSGGTSIGLGDEVSTSSSALVEGCAVEVSFELTLFENELRMALTFFTAMLCAGAAYVGSQ